MAELYRDGNPAKKSNRNDRVNHGDDGKANQQQLATTTKHLT